MSEQTKPKPFGIKKTPASTADTHGREGVYIWALSVAVMGTLLVLFIVLAVLGG